MSSSSIAVCEFFVSKPAPCANQLSTAKRVGGEGRTLLEDGRDTEEGAVEVLLHARLLEGLLELRARWLYACIHQPTIPKPPQKTIQLPGFPVSTIPVRPSANQTKTANRHAPTQPSASASPRGRHTDRPSRGRGAACGG